ncbi:MAG: hypothetical protein LAO07_01235 [Acidobacteriia bacterium]|nr:hypothetical protein [Terriglobia bacterium]
MRIDGHGWRDHLRLLSPLFGLITAVWALRLIMDLAGTPAMIVRMVSVGVAGAVSVLVAAVLIHFKRFGSYPSVLAAAFLLICGEQLLIVMAIAFAALTRTVNVFSSAEYSFGLSPARHIASHLIFGVTFGWIFAGAMGCLVLWMLRRLVPTEVTRQPGKSLP